MSKQSFADLGVSSAVCGALDAEGITEPFAIQSLVVADVLAGRDVLAKSPTGSGKTLAFMVPIIDRIEATDRRPAALILAPTRELATQIVEATLPHRPRPRAQGQGRLRRRRPREAGPRGRQVAHHRRDARPPRGPAPAPRLLSRPRQDPRPRRGRPHARHGLQAARRPDRRAVPARSPDAVLLGHARRRGRPHRRRPTPTTPRCHEHVPVDRAAPPTSSTASCASSATRASAR